METIVSLYSSVSLIILNVSSAKQMGTASTFEQNPLVNKSGDHRAYTYQNEAVHESTCQLIGPTVTKHWSQENMHMIASWNSQHLWKVNVWCGIIHN
uniref:SCP domain-containing protein n=1 Tax=Megaselia scalaris TaxID=36166 RepID=T1GP43_MEGSC